MKRREFLRTAGGATGAAAAGGAATSAGARDSPAALQENATDGGGQNATAGGGQNATDGGGGNQTEGGDGGGGPTETVAVGPGGELIFEPDSLPIQPGTTVVWEWQSNNHNVNPTSIPDDAEWEGHQSLENEGFSYEYTFEVEGTYEYQCDPHAPGMSGTIEVSQDAGSGGGGGAEEVDPAHMGVPLQKHFIGAGAFMGIFSTLVFIFYVLKYGESAHSSAPSKED